jgi:hypothetical protein
VSGYLICRELGRLFTFNLLSSSHHPLHQSMMPSHRCPALKASSSISCDPFDVELVDEMTASDYSNAEHQREEEQQQRRGGRGQQPPTTTQQPILSARDVLIEAAEEAGEAG